MCKKKIQLNREAPGDLLSKRKEKLNIKLSTQEKNIIKFQLDFNFYSNINHTLCRSVPFSVLVPYKDIIIEVDNKITFTPIALSVDDYVVVKK